MNDYWLRKDNKELSSVLDDLCDLLYIPKEDYNKMGYNDFVNLIEKRIVKQFYERCDVPLRFSLFITLGKLLGIDFRSVIQTSLDKLKDRLLTRFLYD